MSLLNNLGKIAIKMGLLITVGAVASGEDRIFAADDSRNLAREIFQADFSSIEISGNNITFYSPDGKVQCESEYAFVGTEKGPGFNMEGESEWYKFESMPTHSCSEYSHVIITEINAPEVMTFWNMRYGNTSFDDLINNPEYSILSPTLTLSNFTAERMAAIVNEDEEETEEMGAPLWSRRESQVSLEDWGGKWITTGTLVDDPALMPFYQAMANVANAANAKHN